jgi:hypothetical protein
MTSFFHNIPWFAWPFCLIYVIYLGLVIFGWLFAGGHQNDTDDMADKFLR